MNTNTNMFQMYQNSGYNNTRNRKRTLILDVDDSGSADTHLGTGGEFKVNLFEPLIIDKHSEVYLDNFITYNSNITNNIDNAVFVLKINEFNMNSSVASSNQNQNIMGSILIPNENNNVDNIQNVVIHKGKKFNYVCDINPGTISSLSGKITNIGGSSAFHGTDFATLTYTLVGISSWVWSTGLSTPLEQDNEITQLRVGGDDKLTAGSTNATILVHTAFNAGEIHFTSEEVLTEDDFAGCGSSPTTEGIIITKADSSFITINTNTDTDNSEVRLIKGFGRFTAEFSIISRE